MEDWKEASESLVEAVLGSALRVHRFFGPGLLEAAYEEALCSELDAHHLSYERQATVPIVYRGKRLARAFRVDLIVEDQLLVEPKSVREVDELHVAQIMTYLRLLRFRRGFILNFNRKLLRDGIRRVSIFPSAWTRPHPR